MGVGAKMFIIAGPGDRLRHGGECGVWGCVLDNADTITKRLDRFGQAFFCGCYRLPTGRVGSMGASRSKRDSISTGVPVAALSRMPAITSST